MSGTNGKATPVILEGGPLNGHVVFVQGSMKLGQIDMFGRLTAEGSYVITNKRDLNTNLSICKFTGWIDTKEIM